MRKISVIFRYFRVVCLFITGVGFPIALSNTYQTAIISHILFSIYIPWISYQNGQAIVKTNIVLITSARQNGTWIN